MPEASVVTERSGNMIRDGVVEQDASRLSEAEVPPDEPGWVVPIAIWTAHESELRHRKHPVGVELPASADAGELVDAEGVVDARGIAFISIRFTAYTDGRGFSLAQLLRTQHGWAGELRAVGDVLIDTVHYLARCGFNSFVLKDGHDPSEALKALTVFSRHYQRSYVTMRGAG